MTGNDVTRSHVTGSDVITGSMFCACPEVHSRAFFLTIVVVQNVPLLMTGSSMANGCDVTKSDVTESDATGIRRPKVGDSPWRVILFVRGA
jgi:hypothetical protein